jgi:hypothetical protein
MAQTEEADEIGRELSAAIERGKEVLAQGGGDPRAAAPELAKVIVGDLSSQARERAAWVTITRLLLSD